MSIQRVMLASHSMSLALSGFINGGGGGGGGGRGGSGGGVQKGGNKKVSFPAKKVRIC